MERDDQNRFLSLTIINAPMVRRVTEGGMHVSEADSMPSKHRLYKGQVSGVLRAIVPGTSFVDVEYMRVSINC